MCALADRLTPCFRSRAPCIRICSIIIYCIAFSCRSVQLIIPLVACFLAVHLSVRPSVRPSIWPYFRWGRCTWSS